jgi:hypothetical protein
MRYKIALPGLVAAALVVGCAETGPTVPDLTETADFHAAPGIVWDDAPVFVIASGKVVGTSKLLRDDKGATVILKTSGLLPWGAYTLWMVVFNNPAACQDGCDEADLGNPDVMGDVLWANGRLIGKAGTASFYGRVLEGDISGSLLAILTGMKTPGLLDARKAEIHFVVRSHGKAIKELAREMITTFGGGCKDQPPGTGTPGPNTCEDQQAALHFVPGDGPEL